MYIQLLILYIRSGDQQPLAPAISDGTTSLTLWPFGSSQTVVCINCILCSGECLGSSSDEGRSELRYALWTAEFRESTDSWTHVVAWFASSRARISVSIFLYVDRSIPTQRCTVDQRSALVDYLDKSDLHRFCVNLVISVAYARCNQRWIARSNFCNHFNS